MEQNLFSTFSIKFLNDLLQLNVNNRFEKNFVDIIFLLKKLFRFNTKEFKNKNDFQNIIQNYGLVSSLFFEKKLQFFFTEQELAVTNKQELFNLVVNSTNRPGNCFWFTSSVSFENSLPGLKNELKAFSDNFSKLSKVFYLLENSDNDLFFNELETLNQELSQFLLSDFFKSTDKENYIIEKYLHFYISYLCSLIQFYSIFLKRKILFDFFDENKNLPFQFFLEQFFSILLWDVYLLTILFNLEISATYLNEISDLVYRQELYTSKASRIDKDDLFRQLVDVNASTFASVLEAKFQNNKTFDKNLALVEFLRNFNTKI